MMTTENQKQEIVFLSKKEIEILRFIHEFGFCEIKQIIKLIQLGKSSSYDYVKILKRLELLLYFRKSLDSPGVYYLTKKAVKLLALDLPALSHVPLNIYDHHLTVIDVHLKCAERYPDMVWMSERRLLQNKAFQGHTHLPDGAGYLPNQEPYAIEVECTRKSHKRMEEILHDYGLRDVFKEVWYFASNDVIPLLQEVAKNLSYIKIFHLENFLNDSE